MRLSAADLSGINRFKRIQVRWYLTDCFPVKKDGVCDCGCGEKLTGKRRRWATNECQNEAVDFYRLRYGHSDEIRDQVNKRDKGACVHCGVIGTDWDADHILEVHQGGGGCGLENFQTLCTDCHKDKSKLRFKLVA